MAVVPMQKVAIITRDYREEELLKLLHEEGVCDISHRRDTATIDHTDMNFRVAELDFAITALKNAAPPKALSEAKKTESHASVDDVLHASVHTDVLGIIEEVHAMEKEGQRLAATLRGEVSPSGAIDAAAPQAAYVTSTVIEDRTKMVTGTAADTLSSEQIQAQRDRARLHARRQELCGQLPALLLVKRNVRWMQERQSARDTLQKTKKSVMLSGWIRTDGVTTFERTLKKRIPESALLKVQPDDGETPPVCLQNAAMLTPFESVTTLYGLPMHHEMDPTAFLSLFFILFYALCLTDAGYGMVQTIIMAGVLWKTKKSMKEAPLFWLLFFSGIVTIIVSVPFGGWFGMTPDQAPAFMTELRSDGARWFKGQRWNLSDQTGITFLQNLSLALGIIHLSFGILLGAWSKARSGRLAAGLWMDGTTLAFIGVTLLFFFGPIAYRPFFTYGIGVSLLLMIWGKGHGNSLTKRPLMGLLQTLNFFLGMMGNVLSYLRILALGLVTGALAFTVNLVAAQISALLPWFLAVPVAILIYIIGHLMNIVLNALGAFIHSGRLQFVEFFSQFFEGGGRPFRPFVRS